MTAPGSEGLSIIVPAFGRARLLDALLASLSVACASFASPSEVLVLDNTPDERAGRIREITASHGAAYYRGSDNVSEKRNQGVELAQHDLVLFLDSDCTVDPGLLAHHHDTLLATGAAGCLGLLRFAGQESATWRAVATLSVLDCFSFPEQFEDVSWGPTANISFRREWLRRVGGFSTAFARPGGEDVDLGFRIVDAGGRIACDRQAIAHHSTSTWLTFGKVARRFFAYGAGDVLLIRRHPHRSVVDAPTPTHVFALVVVLTVAAYFASGNAAVAIGPVVWLFVTTAVYVLASATRERRRPLMQAITTYVLRLYLLAALDAGRLVHAVLGRVPTALWRRVVFYDGQAAADWPDITASMIASLAGLAVTLLLLLSLAA